MKETIACLKAFGSSVRPQLKFCYFFKKKHSRDLLSKNTGKRLEDKALIAGFDNTFNWLVRCNVFVKRTGDAYSRNSKLNDINPEAVRNYVMSLVEKKSQTLNKSLTKSKN